MIVYLVMLVLVAIFSVMAVQHPYMMRYDTQNDTSSAKNKKPDKVFVWIVFLCIAFVATFRYGVGMDFFSYFKTKGWADNFSEGNYSEPGFTLFSIICSFLFGETNGAITMGAALVTVFVFVFTIAKRTENFPISIVLFIITGVFTGLFNGIRQYMATAILFCGYRFIVDKKPVKWLLVVLLASTFHVTAILMFFTYFICNLKCGWNLAIIYIVIAVILLFAYEPLFELVGALKQDEIDMNGAYMLGSVNILRVAVQCVPVALLFFVKVDKINEDNEARFLFNICLLNAAIAVAAMNSPYLSRFWIYTNCFQVLMYPKIFNKMNKSDRDFIVGFMILFYLAFWVYEILNSPSLRQFSWIFNYLRN